MSELAVASLLSDMVRSLAIAWKKLGAYPKGHPALEGAIETVLERLGTLTATTGDLALGVTRDGLLFNNRTLDFDQAQKFAQALYLRDVAVLRIGRGVNSTELDIFLRALGSDQARSAAPFWDELAAAGVRHIGLQPVDYSAIRATEGLEDIQPDHPASLRDALIQALLSGRQLSKEGAHRLTQLGSSLDISQLVAELLHTPVSDAEQRDSTTGDSTQGESGSSFSDELTAPMSEVSRPAGSPVSSVAAAVSRYLSNSDISTRKVAAHQVAELLRALPEEMKETVLTAALRSLASDESAGPALQVLCNSLSADLVLKAMRSIRSEGSTLSTHALRLAQALSSVTKDQLSARAKDLDSSALAAELMLLMKDEDIDRFNPEDHQTLLGEIALHLPDVAEQTEFSKSELSTRLDSVTPGTTTDAVARTLLDLISSHGRQLSLTAVLRQLREVFQFYLNSGQIDQALDLVRSLQEFASTLASGAPQSVELSRFFEELVTEDAITALLENQTPGGDAQVSLDRLVKALGAAAAKNFLLALAAEENRSRRRRLYNMVASLGTIIVPEATRLLKDERWFVIRNMIVLLRNVGDRSSMTEIRRCANHPDLRVRFEAIKSLLAFDPQVPLELLDNAINDPDPKLAEAAIILVGSYGIREGVQSLLKILDKWDFLGRRRSLRIKSLKALGELGDPTALTRLDRFFREGLLSVISIEERRAAWKSLESYPAAAREDLVSRGLKSRDPEIRKISSKLARNENAATSRADETVRGNSPA